MLGKEPSAELCGGKKRNSLRPQVGVGAWDPTGAHHKPFFKSSHNLVQRALLHQQMHIDLGYTPTQPKAWEPRDGGFPQAKPNHFGEGCSGAAARPAAAPLMSPALLGHKAQCPHDCAEKECLADVH